ncbi:MAG: MFS transporter [Dehalococcoidia bacterium]|nr:MFS transporter [Dehalococcoidia bacterium]
MENHPQAGQHKRILGLNANVFFLGLVSFLTDVSSEMIFTLLPLFLANILGAATVIIGLIEGVAESTASLIKIISGWFSDKLGERKSLAIVGYVLSTLAKPFMYIATTWGMVLGVRFTDRLGKGVRTAPRDALVADSVSAEERGKGFGFHRAMDTSGAALGLIVAAAIVFLLQKGTLELAQGTYQWLVLIGIIPAVLALFVFFFVREAKKDSNIQSHSSSKVGPLYLDGSSQGIKSGFDIRFKLFLGIMFLFTLGNSSDAFLILRAQNLGNSVLYILLMLILFNVVYAVVSTPAGVVSDRLGRRRVIVLGWLIYALTYLGFAMASASWQVWLLFVFYGVYYGLAEGVTRAFVADLVPEEKRGTAYGLFHGVVGIALLPASIIAGWLWQAISPAAPFYFGAGLACLAMIGLLVLVRE